MAEYANPARLRFADDLPANAPPCGPPRRLDDPIDPDVERVGGLALALIRLRFARALNAPELLAGVSTRRARSTPTAGHTAADPAHPNPVTRPDREAF